jgi:L-histidine N-alpha-methyltransferase
MSMFETDLNNRLAIDVYLNNNGFLDTMAEDVRQGLSEDQKRLSPKYFYDAVGSDLFEQITDLPEYYPTRAERDLLLEIAADLMAEIRPTEIVELGSGSSAKTRALFDAPSTASHLSRYVPFDISESTVRSTANNLLSEYPFLNIHGVIGDFEHHLSKIPAPNGRRLLLFLGGTIGNLDRDQRIAFLSDVRSLLRPEDRLLIGLDLVKDIKTIESAYNDAAGITAEFNRNMLKVINKGLVADFQPEAFQHRAFFNVEESRIEMHLVPDGLQRISISELGMTFTVQPGETIWTESSYKFTEEAVEEMLTSAGLVLEHFYANEQPNRRFGLILARPL